jgi:hypothetical protein
MRWGVAQVKPNAGACYLVAERLLSFGEQVRVDTLVWRAGVRNFLFQGTETGDRIGT